MPANDDIYAYVLAMRALLRAEGEDLLPVNEEAKQLEADHACPHDLLLRSSSRLICLRCFGEEEERQESDSKEGRNE